MPFTPATTMWYINRDDGNFAPKSMPVLVLYHNVDEHKVTAFYRTSTGSIGTYDNIDEARLHSCTAMRSNINNFDAEDGQNCHGPNTKNHPISGESRGARDQDRQ